MYGRAVGGRRFLPCPASLADLAWKVGRHRGSGRELELGAGAWVREGVTVRGTRVLRC